MNTPKRFQFRSDDGLSIACVKWGNGRHVRGVVQIAHGRGEHIGRYAELAQTLADAEFVVYGNDHRGHGLTAKLSESYGDFGPGGFDQIVEDMVSLRVIAKDEHRGKPYILLGHSMGYFAAQQFVLDHSHSIDGLALSGSGTLDGLARIAQSVAAGEAGRWPRCRRYRSKAHRGWPACHGSPRAHSSARASPWRNAPAGPQ